MALPALNERFESLAAETRSRSQEVTHAAEVLSITLGGLVRSTNSLVETLGKLRSLLLSAGVELRTLSSQIDRDEDAPSKVTSCAAIMASMKRFRRRIAQPYFVGVDGTSVLTTAERLEGLKTDTASDGRTVRRLGKRVREAADDCEKQRLRFIVTMDNLMVGLEAYAVKHYDPTELQNAYAQALGEQSIKRHPVVNAYLAR